MKKPNPHSKAINTCIATAFIFAVFISWGFVANVTGKASPASIASKMAALKSHKSTDRETVLNAAQKTQKDADGKSVLLYDPFVKNQWGIERTAANKAWEITQGSKDVVIAVIDTGIDANHKDLTDNLWVNAGETGVVGNEFCKKQKSPLTMKECNKAKNGVDDDGNGFIDDVHGWNFVHNDHALTDNHGHGTHIAGIIAAKNHTGTGVVGVAPNVSVMVLKYYDPKSTNSNNLQNTVQAIRYAIKMHANIINYSGGGTDYSAEEFAAVKDAEKAGILFVAAAGNERSNSDESGKHYYPADYGLSNIISVTAVNPGTSVLPSSNYGVRTVDLAAPGENINSTLPGNTYGMMTGTSQATAFVTGVAALVISNNREFNAGDVKKYILTTGDEYPTLLSKTGTAKLLNSYKALTSLDKGVSTNGVTATNTARVSIEGFAAGLSNNAGDLKSVKFDTSAFRNGNDAKRDQEAGLPDPNSGDAESIAVFGSKFVKAIDHGKIKGFEPTNAVYKQH